MGSGGEQEGLEEAGEERGKSEGGRRGGGRQADGEVMYRTVAMWWAMKSMFGE